MNRTSTVPKLVIKTPPKFCLYVTYPFDPDNLCKGDIATGEESSAPVGVREENDDGYCEEYNCEYYGGPEVEIAICQHGEHHCDRRYVKERVAPRRLFLNLPGARQVYEPTKLLRFWNVQFCL